MQEIRWHQSDVKAWQDRLRQCALRLETELSELKAGSAAWDLCVKGNWVNAANQSGVGQEIGRALNQAIEKGTDCAQCINQLSRKLYEVCALFDEAEQKNAAIADTAGFLESMRESRFPRLSQVLLTAGSLSDAAKECVLYTDTLLKGSQWLIPDWLEKAAQQSLGGLSGVRSET